MKIVHLNRITLCLALSIRAFLVRIFIYINGHTDSVLVLAWTDKIPDYETPHHPSMDVVTAEDQLLTIDKCLSHFSEPEVRIEMGQGRGVLRYQRLSPSPPCYPLFLSFSRTHAHLFLFSPFSPLFMWLFHSLPHSFFLFLSFLRFLEMQTHGFVHHARRKGEHRKLLSCGPCPR